MKPLLWIAAVAVIMVVWLRRARSDLAEGRRWLPARLQRAALAYAERTFRSPRLRVVAKLDRAYRVEGRLILMELKSRRRHVVHRSDIFQLSGQRVAVEEQTGEPVDETAVVVTLVDGERRSHVVPLLSKPETERLIRRRHAILRGTISAAPAQNPAVCRSCAYQKECQSERWGADEH